MSKQERVMVDIETMGTERGAAIVSIGAVRFTTSGFDETFHRSISLKSCQDAGLTVDAETLEWWLTQNSEAKEQLVGGDSLRAVLHGFSEWYDGADEIWANSPSFDCELLEAAYDAVGLEEPWEFWEERDVRTVKSLPIANEREHRGVEHDALDDAVHQARVVAKTLGAIDSDTGVSTDE